MKLYVLSLYSIEYDAESIIGIFDDPEKAMKIFSSNTWMKRDGNWYSNINEENEILYIKEYVLNESLYS